MRRSEALRVLGLAAGADDDALKRAYKRRVFETHPDRNGGDSCAFLRVSEAYRALSEPVEQAYEQPVDGGDTDGPCVSEAFRACGYPGHDDTLAEHEVTLEQAYAGASVRVRGPLGAIWFKLPERMQDRYVVVFRGAGELRATGRSDLRVTFRIAPHPRFDVDGYDIATEVEVSASAIPDDPFECREWRVRVEAPDGNRYETTVPSWLRSGDFIVLDDLGLRSADGMGALYVFVRTR